MAVVCPYCRAGQVHTRAALDTINVACSAGCFALDLDPAPIMQRIGWFLTFCQGKAPTPAKVLAWTAAQPVFVAMCAEDAVLDAGGKIGSAGRVLAQLWLDVVWWRVLSSHVAALLWPDAPAVVRAA